MRTTALVLLVSALLISVLVGSSRGSSTSLVSYSFQGTLTSVSGLAEEAPPTGIGVAVGDIITGTFAYLDTATGLLGTYNMTGKSDEQSFVVDIYSPSNLTVPVFSDNYVFTTTSYYEAKVAYNSAGGNTTLTLQGDTSYKTGAGYSYAETGVPAFVLTLNNPTSAGGFSSTHLNLPVATGSSYGISNFLSTGGTLSWDPPNLSFAADVSDFQPIAQYLPPPLPTVPEPSGLLMAALGLTTAAGVSRYARRRGIRAARRG